MRDEFIPACNFSEISVPLDTLQVNGNGNGNIVSIARLTRTRTLERELCLVPRLALQSSRA
jgi:hypothetical protein